MRTATAISTAIIIAICLVCTYGIWHWTVDRYYVPPGMSLRLRYKGPPLPILPGNRPQTEPGHFAQVDEHGDPLELGVLEQMVGPGRHFYNPFWWERQLVPDVMVEPGEVAMVVSKLGDDLESGAFLVDGDLGEIQSKGILAQTAGARTVSHQRLRL